MYVNYYRIQRDHENYLALRLYCLKNTKQRDFKIIEKIASGIVVGQ